jgi:DNA invertase Pin-like site-specific DNA recombinase
MTTKEMKQSGTVKKECFSYIRFSSLKQAKGNSEDRQLEIAPRVAAEKGWLLREDLCVENLGLSAYKGSNLKIINGIIEAAEAGNIPKGSVMIIEALDRLTRISVDDAYQLFRRVIKSGVEIYTDRSSRHLTEADLNNPMSLMLTVVELDAAFQYSDKLSYRVGKAWNKKRELLASEGKKLTKMVVAWVDKETWEPIPEREIIIKKIFNLYNSGYGISAIVRQFNNEKVPTFGKGKQGWSSSYIWQVLHTRAVIGEFQPHVTKSSETGNYYKRIKSGDAIQNYFPAIINTKLFYEVQAKLGNNTKVRKTDQITNLFSGVAYCECGAKMYLAESNKRGQSRKYYMCWNKVKGLGCNAPSIRYEPIENIFLITAAQNAEKLFKNDSSVSGEVQSLRGKKGEFEKQIANITEYVIAGNGTKALVQRQATLEKEVDEIRLQLQIAESRLSAKTSKPQIDFGQVTIKQLADSINVRRKVRDFILSHVESIKFSLDRKNMGIQFRSDSIADMFNRTIDGLPTLKQPHANN